MCGPCLTCLHGVFVVTFFVECDLYEVVYPERLKWCLNRWRMRRTEYAFSGLLDNQHTVIQGMEKSSPFVILVIHNDSVK